MNSLVKKASFLRLLRDLRKALGIDADDGAESVELPDRGIRLSAGESNRRMPPAFELKLVSGGVSVGPGVVLSGTSWFLSDTIVAGQQDGHIGIYVPVEPGLDLVRTFSYTLFTAWGEYEVTEKLYGHNTVRPSAPWIARFSESDLNQSITYLKVLNETGGYFAGRTTHYDYDIFQPGPLIIPIGRVVGGKVVQFLKTNVSVLYRHYSVNNPPHGFYIEFF